MPINYVDSGGDTKGTFEIVNGHLKALREITKNFNIKNEAHTLAFLIEIMREHSNGSVSIDGSTYRPSSVVLKDGV